MLEEDKPEKIGNVYTGARGQCFEGVPRKKYDEGREIEEQAQGRGTYLGRMRIANGSCNEAKHVPEIKKEDSRSQITMVGHLGTESIKSLTQDESRREREMTGANQKLQWRQATPMGLPTVVCGHSCRSKA